MSFKEVNLNRLLRILGASPSETTSMLREDLRSERKKIDGYSEGGGHFQAPFWSDAKAHVIGVFDLHEQTLLRIYHSEQRKRLYPMLSKGFLHWFDELKRTTNERVGWKESKAHSRYNYPGLDLKIKVEGLLGLGIGNDRHLLIYPYFCEKPALSERWARVGLWLMSAALSDFDISEMHILDVIRGKSYSGPRTFLRGDEEAIFLARFKQLVDEWRALRPQYGLA